MGTGIGTYVRERRQELGLSQSQLADRIGQMSGQSDISRLERGEIDLPRLPTLVKLASALEVSLGDLLIAAGWFAGQDTLETVLGEIEAELDTILEMEAELDTILEMEGEARSRADRLRAMIRELNAMSGISVTIVTDSAAHQ